MAVLFPGEQSWELWRTGTSVRQGEGDVIDSPSDLDLDRRFDSEAEAGFPKGDKNVVALPVRSVMALPMWVRAPGEREMHQAAKLQLERAGLRARNEPQGIDFSLIERNEEAGSLILAQGLTEHTPQLAGSSAAATDHFPTPYLLPLPPDHLTIWRELGRLVAAITRQGKVVYFDALTAPKLDSVAIQEVHRMAAQMSLLGMLDAIQGIVLWTMEGDAQEIADATGLPVDRASRPAPVVPQGIISQLEPRSARLARELAQKRSQRRKIFRSAAAVIGALALIVAGGLGWLTWQRGQLRAQVAELLPQAAEVAAMQERWAVVAPAVDRDAFVLESLLAVQSIPAAQSVALERFEIAADRITMEGSAEGATQALRFLDALSACDSFADFEWSFPQPTLDGASAHFEAEGLRSTNGSSVGEDQAR